MKQKNKPSLGALWAITNSIVRIVEEFLSSERGGSKVFFRLKPIDQAQLFTLCVWSARHHVSIEEILRMIVPILRAQIHRKLRGALLGLSIRSLTSSKAEQILTEEIAKKYPDKENILAWKSREREYQLLLEAAEDSDEVATRDIGKHAFSSAEAFMKRYARQALQERSVFTAAMLDRKRKQKHYRGNPWI